jgi:hypothetical protein
MVVVVAIMMFAVVAVMIIGMVKISPMAPTAAAAIPRENAAGGGDQGEDGE